MSKRSQSLRALVSERLTAAAEEIFILVERTIVEYEEELSRAKEENQRILESVMNSQILRTNGSGRISVENQSDSAKIKPEQQKDISDTGADEEVLIVKQENIDNAETCEVEIKKEVKEEFVISLPCDHSSVAMETHRDHTVVSMETHRDHCSIATEMNIESPTNNYVGFANTNNMGPEKTWTSPLNQNLPDYEAVMETWTEERNMTQGQSVVLESGLSPKKGKTKGRLLWMKSLCCPFCMRTFSTENNLKLHVMLHTGEQPFQCSMCEKGFRTKGLLNNHMKTNHSEIIMPKVFVRDTDWTTFLEILKKAAEQHEKQGLSVRQAAANFGVCRSTLQRFVKQSEDGRASFGYQNCVSGRIFAPDMEKALANHVRDLDQLFHGLSARKCRALAYEFAKQNHLDKIPKGWEENKMAGEDWFEGFKKRHHLNCRKPDTTSLAKSMAFNKTTVREFFGKLKEAYERHQFTPRDVYSLDETDFTTVQGSVKPADRGQPVTVVCSVTAAGNALPPFYAFKDNHMKPEFLNCAVPGSTGAALSSGWNVEMFRQSFLPFFIAQTRCSPDRPVLLILDNHQSHISVGALTLARASGVVFLTLPPHTSHRLQPLDRTVFGPMKAEFNRSANNWRAVSPGGDVSIFHMAGLIHQSYCAAMKPSNIIAGFKATGIYPFNPDVFTEKDFLPRDVGDFLNTLAGEKTANVGEKLVNVGENPADVGDQREKPADVGEKPAGAFPLPEVGGRQPPDVKDVSVTDVGFAPVAGGKDFSLADVEDVPVADVEVQNRIETMVRSEEESASSLMVVDEAHSSAAPLPISRDTETDPPAPLLFSSASPHTGTPPTSSDFNTYNSLLFYNSLLD